MICPNCAREARVVMDFTGAIPLYHCQCGWSGDSATPPPREASETDEDAEPCQLCEQYRDELAAVTQERDGLLGSERELVRMLECIACLLGNGDPSLIQPEQLATAVSLTLKQLNTVSEENAQLKAQLEEAKETIYHHVCAVLGSFTEEEGKWPMADKARNLHADLAAERAKNAELEALVAKLTTQIQNIPNP